MKVCAVHEAGVFGGPARRIIEIAKALKKYNIHTHIVFPRLNSERFAAEIKKAELKSTSIYLNRLTKEKIILIQYVLFFVYEVFLLYKIFRKKKFDLVQANGSQQFKAAIAARLANIHLVWVLEDTMMDKNVKRICEYLIHHWAKGIIVVSAEVFEYYIEGTKLESKLCTQIYPHVDTKIFNPNSVEKLENFNKGKTIITTVAGLNPTKGIEYFIEMAALLLKNNKNILFLVAGTKLASHSLYYRNLMDLVHKRNIGENITFLGLFDDIPSLLKTTDIFVCTSISESGPMAVWEAMSMEKAIVSTNVGAVKKFIKDGFNGYVVPIKDYIELYNKVSLLVLDKKKVKLFGHEARIISKKHLDVTISAKKYKDFYTDILTENNRENSAQA